MSWRMPWQHFLFQSELNALSLGAPAKIISSKTFFRFKSITISMSLLLLTCPSYHLTNKFQPAFASVPCIENNFFCFFFIGLMFSGSCRPNGLFFERRSNLMLVSKTSSSQALDSSETGVAGATSVEVAVSSFIAPFTAWLTHRWSHYFHQFPNLTSGLSLFKQGERPFIKDSTSNTRKYFSLAHIDLKKT